MRRPLILALSLAASLPALAEKPWEARINFAVPVPVELPAIPPTNPFAATLATLPSPVTTPLREKFTDTFSVQATAYVDTGGMVRRAVVSKAPLPGIADALRPEILETSFTPARSGGAPVATWLPFAFDLHGRIDEGRVARMQPSAPDSTAPPVVETAPTPVVSASDLDLAATPVEHIDQPPNAKKFRAKVPSHQWTQSVRLLAEVGKEGRCQRVVFLSCPDGLRQWLLASMGAWTFRPGTTKDGAVTAWVQLDGDVEVDIGSISSDAMRVTPQGWTPRAAAAAGGGPLPVE